MNKDYARLCKTIELAKKSEYTKHDGSYIMMGAKIYIGKICVAAANNCNKTHPIQLKYNHSAGITYKQRDYLHAEMSAMIKAFKAGYDLSKATLYIARTMHSGTGLAAPCGACRAAIKEFGIKKIVYTTYDGYVVEYITEDNNE